MSYIEREFYDKGYSSIDVFYGNDFIKTINLSDTRFEETGNTKIFVDYDIQIEEFNVTLTLEIDKRLILIVVEADNYLGGELDLDEFDFSPSTEEDFLEENTSTPFVIPFYMPTITYTNLASSIVYDINSENIMPLFDIESLERFETYINDDIISFKHFIDLEFSNKITNKDVIEDVKITRKKEAQLYGAGNQRTPLPDKIYANLDDSEIINIYESIEKRELVIPILNWKRYNDITDDIETLLNKFEFIGIRVSSSYSIFNEKISDLRDRFSDKLDCIYIIFDMNNNFALEQFINVIKSSSKVFKRTIYLGTPFSASDISKKRKNPCETDINHIYSNKPIEIFENILKNIPIFGYGDYCGFDRKTITFRPTDGRPTARVVLASVDLSKKLLVRRAWDDRDLKMDSKGNESQGLIHSMNKLMLDLKDGVLDIEDGIKFLNTENYDTDLALKEFYPERPAAGLLKTICLRHNFLSIVKNFMSNENS